MSRDIILGHVGVRMGNLSPTRIFGLPNNYLEYICGQPADDPTSSPPGCA